MAKYGNKACTNTKNTPNPEIAEAKPVSKKLLNTARSYDLLTLISLSFDKESEKERSYPDNINTKACFALDFNQNRVESKEMKHYMPGKA